MARNHECSEFSMSFRIRWRVPGNTGACCNPRAKRLQRLTYSSPILLVKDGYAGMWTKKRQKAGLLLPKAYRDWQPGFDQEVFCILISKAQARKNGFPCHPANTSPCRTCRGLSPPLLRSSTTLDGRYLRTSRPAERTTKRAQNFSILSSCF